MSWSPFLLVFIETRDVELLSLPGHVPYIAKDEAWPVASSGVTLERENGSKKWPKKKNDEQSLLGGERVVYFGISISRRMIHQFICFNS